MDKKNDNEVFGVIPTWWPYPDKVVAETASKTAAAADAWVLGHADYFSPISEWIDKKDRYLRRKSFAELSIYLYIADNMGEQEMCSKFDSMVAEFTNSPQFINLIKRYPKQLLLYGAAVNYVKHKKILSKDAEDAVRSVLERKAVWSVERVPHRMLDLWNFLNVYGWDPNGLNAEGILSKSCLNYQPDIIESTLHEAYALTHNLLFYYNFGVALPGITDIRLPHNLEDVISGLVLRYCAAGNYDIVLELVYVAALHQQLPKWLFRFVLLNMSIGEGQIVIRGPENPNAAELSKRDSNYIEWAENYHTTLVAASAFRYIGESWSDVDKYAARKHEDLTESEFVALFKTGCAFSALSAYELPLGAYRTMLAMQEALPLSTQFLEHCVDFIRFQKNPDGTFGYWQDEETLYFRSGGDKNSFNREIVAPVSELCEQAIAG